MVMRVCVAAVAVVGGMCVPTTAAAERDRQARAALALAAGAKDAGGAARPAVAPAPREAGPTLTYAEAYAKSLEHQLPLVVWVGTDGPPAGCACTSRVVGLAGFDPPVGVVAYPFAGKLHVEAVLVPEETTPESLKRAVERANRKMSDPPVIRPPTLPQPLDWFVGVPPTGCVCGDHCDCAAKGRKCPHGCPVAGPKDSDKRTPGDDVVKRAGVWAPPGYPPPLPGFVWVRDPRGPHGWGLLAVGLSADLSPSRVPSSCPGGSCRAGR